MIKEYIKLLRVPQWIKNSFVFVPLLFSQLFFRGDYFLTVLGGFFLFCLVSSIVYIINDIIDVEADKLHPVKKNRPIPSGKIPVKTALIIVAVLAVLLILFLYNCNIKFITVVAGYLVLNLFYSLSFKHIVLLDVFSIAAGFMLRIIGGAVIINVYISSWLILTTMFISLFLGIMKRHSELYLAVPDGESPATRKVLVYYSQTFTQQMATVAASGVIICYALYTVSARTISVFHTENLIYTTPFVVFGIFRYMFLVYIDQKGENTTDLMISDIPTIVNSFLYLVSVFSIIYFLK